MAKAINKEALPPVPNELVPKDELGSTFFLYPGFSPNVNMTPDLARKLSTVYRCVNIISDDIASLPLQLFERLERGSRRVKPDGSMRNVAYLAEIEPNRWQTPFIYKKTLIMDLLNFGNAYAWRPLSDYPEFFHLEPIRVLPVIDRKGNRFYRVNFENGSERYLPDAEILHLMINPDRKGLFGRSVLSFNNDLLNRQANAYKSRNQIMGNGLLPTAVIKTSGKLDKASREVIKNAYINATEGGVAVMDSSILDYKEMTMKATDVQFLESIVANDKEIANYYGVPEYKLNLGKQSYQSNEQQQLDYLGGTINPFLVQVEQGARLKWLSIEEQAERFFRFERKALLQIDSKTQADFIHLKVMDGIYSPNEARAIDDLEPFEGGDEHFFPMNMGIIGSNGQIAARNQGNGVETLTPKETKE
jgi:HK97 family phage portal protein